MFFNKMTSSAFSLCAAIPNEGFEITQGEPVLGGLKGENIKHFFCPSCMTWMYTEIPDLPFTNVRATLLDKTDWIGVPWCETYTSEKLEWVKLGSPMSFEKFPDGKEYGPLLQGY